jgi:hypothetical protein
MLRGFCDLFILKVWLEYNNTSSLENLSPLVRVQLTLDRSFYPDLFPDINCFILPLLLYLGSILFYHNHQWDSQLLPGLDLPWCSVLSPGLVTLSSSGSFFILVDTFPDPFWLAFHMRMPSIMMLFLVVAWQRICRRFMHAMVSLTQFLLGSKIPEVLNYSK